MTTNAWTKKTEDEEDRGNTDSGDETNSELLTLMNLYSVVDERRSFLENSSLYVHVNTSVYRGTRT